MLRLIKFDKFVRLNESNYIYMGRNILLRFNS